MENTETLVNRQRTGRIAAFIIAVVAVLALILVGSLPGMGANSSMAQGRVALPAPSSTPTPTATAKMCSDTWVIVESDNANNRWFAEGVASIRNASNDKEAMDAAFDWQEKVRTDPDLSAGAAKIFFKRDVDRATLVDSKGCATKAAVDLDLELGVAIAEAVVTPNDVPSTAFGSGVNNNVVVGDTTAGIGGDLSAIQLVLSDGRTIWIMARCGNVATPEAPPFPPGVTDNPPRCEFNPQLPPESPDCVAPKDPSQDPGPRGNAPIGQGPNADPGPGTYLPPEVMVQPPSTPYTPPPAPAPEPPAPTPPTPENPKPAPVPTKDPAPAPPPETAAPKPSEAPSTCPIPPGMTSC